MLDGIFRGFLEWILEQAYSFIEAGANSMLEVFSMDLQYFEEHIPIASMIVTVIISVAWALLLGNLVFQAARGMMLGLGVEGEDPKFIFARTFIFAFLLLCARPVCEVGLSISRMAVDMLKVPATVAIPDLRSVSFGMPESVSWIAAILGNFLILFQLVKLFLEVGERYVVLAILTLLSPLAFSMGGSKSTGDIFKGWARMFASMCLMLILNVVFFKIFLSAMDYLPTTQATIPWLIFMLGIAKTARRIDSIIARIGLNPAITGKEGSGTMLMMMLKQLGQLLSRVKMPSFNLGRGGGSGFNPFGGSGPGININPFGFNPFSGLGQGLSGLNPFGFLGGGQSRQERQYGTGSQQAGDSYGWTAQPSADSGGGTNMDQVSGNSSYSQSSGSTPVRGGGGTTRGGGYTRHSKSISSEYQSSQNKAESTTYDSSYKESYRPESPNSASRPGNGNAHSYESRPASPQSQPPSPGGDRAAMNGGGTTRGSGRMTSSLSSQPPDYQGSRDLPNADTYRPDNQGKRGFDRSAINPISGEGVSRAGEGTRYSADNRPGSGFGKPSAGAESLSTTARPQASGPRAYSDQQSADKHSTARPDKNTVSRQPAAYQARTAHPAQPGINERHNDSVRQTGNPDSPQRKGDRQ